MTRRICMVLPVHWAARMGGAQYQARLLIERLLCAYDVQLFYLTVRADRAFVAAGYEVRQISQPGGLHRYGFFFDARRLYRALADIEPDIIYQQIGCAYTGIAAFYARRHGATMVWRVSSDRTVRPEAPSWRRPHRAVEKRFLEYGVRHADLILAQTEYQKAELSRHYGRNDVVVIPNFHPIPADPGGKASRKLVVWIANLKPLKNPHAFVRLAHSFGDREDVAFLMIGAQSTPGAWCEDLLELIAKVPNLRYAGALTQEEVNDVLVDAHVLVNTSDYEGFSNTFIQAWLRRVPVVSLNVDPDRLLSERQLGCLSSGEEQMCLDVRRLLDEPGLLARMGERCRRYAEARHSLVNIDELARLLRLEERADRSPPQQEQGALRVRAPVPHGRMSPARPRRG